MSMNRAKIEAAKSLAQEFIERCDEGLKQLDAENDSRGTYYAHRHAIGIDEPNPPHGPQPDDYSYGSKRTGALRRRSMDLTRLLAELRK